MFSLMCGSYLLIVMYVYWWVISGARGQETRKGPGKGYKDLRAGGERVKNTCDMP